MTLGEAGGVRRLTARHGEPLNTRRVRRNGMRKRRKPAGKRAPRVHVVTPTAKQGLGWLDSEAPSWPS